MIAGDPLRCRPGVVKTGGVVFMGVPVTGSRGRESTLAGARLLSDRLPRRKLIGDLLVESLPRLLLTREGLVMPGLGLTVMGERGATTDDCGARMAGEGLLDLPELSQLLRGVDGDALRMLLLLLLLLLRELRGEIGAEIRGWAELDRLGRLNDEFDRFTVLGDLKAPMLLGAGEDDRPMEGELRENPPRERDDCICELDRPEPERRSAANVSRSSLPKPVIRATIQISIRFDMALTSWRASSGTRGVFEKNPPALQGGRIPLILTLPRKPYQGSPFTGFL